MTCISKMTNHTHRTNIGHLMQLLYCFSVALTETSDHLRIPSPIFERYSIALGLLLVVSTIRYIMIIQTMNVSNLVILLVSPIANWPLSKGG